MKQKRQSESLGGDEPLDLVNYIEFQNNFKSAQRFHNKALKSMRSFWRLLLEDDVNVADLPRAFKIIDSAEAKVTDITTLSDRIRQNYTTYNFSIGTPNL
jgi:hypothetical protein